MPILVQIGLYFCEPNPAPFSYYFRASSGMIWSLDSLWWRWWIPNCLVFFCWTAWLVIPLWRGTRPSIGRVVAGLLAGIVLVDLIAVSPWFDRASPYFALLFPLALLLQRFVPAT
jgi:hypothetical protein